jgi:hypothetical protein
LRRLEDGVVQIGSTAVSVAGRLDCSSKAAPDPAAAFCGFGRYRRVDTVRFTSLHRD